MDLDPEKLAASIARSKELVDVSCDICGHQWQLQRREAEPFGGTIGTCPKCGAGRWEGKGSKMLDRLLALESGLSESELRFVESLSHEREKWRRQGFKPNHLPSKKQIDWLTAIYERLT